MDQQSKWGSIIAGAGMLFICVATLTPGSTPAPGDAAAACRDWCDDSVVADFARNIVLFAPMAFGLGLLRVRARWIVLYGTLLSATVEVLQLHVIPGRDSSVLDWISNTLGTAAGVLLVDWLGTLLRPAPRLARALMCGGLVAWTGILVLGAWGIQPAPGGFPYWGQRAPRLSRFAPFLGELISARADGIELQSSLMKDGDVIRYGLRHGQMRVDAVVRPGPRPTSSVIAPIARIADAAQREILMLGRGGHELVLRVRLRATTLRLETPAFALAHAFQGVNSIDPESLDTVETVSGTLSAGRVQLVATGAGSKSRTFDLSPAAAWSFFLPWDYWYGPNSVWISFLWIGALLVPVAYWAAFARRPRWLLLIGVLIIVTDLIAIPVAFRLPAMSGWFYVAVVAGLAVGWSLSVLTQRSGASRVT